MADPKKATKAVGGGAAGPGAAKKAGHPSQGAAKKAGTADKAKVGGGKPKPPKT